MHIVMIGIVLIAMLFILSMRIHSQCDGRCAKHDPQWLERHHPELCVRVQSFHERNGLA